ncbi:MAG TPA: cupredoxin domain-containing protein [Actinomycetota bacterium]|nr:cupredoxin domain-containing protein [Actinomycetota bacterium]
MARSRWLGLVAGLFVLSIVLAACGGDDEGGGETGGGGGGGGGGNTIVIEGFAFDPSTISVSGPTEFTITNNDSATHTFTLDDGSVDAEIAGGESTVVTIDVSESTGFVCRFHPQMTGTVEVA